MVLKIYFVYMVIINLIGLFSMWSDKRRARNRAGRYPEKVLILIAFLGGALGSWLGMYLFRHKTRHKKFVILVPVALIGHAYLMYRLLLWFGKVL